MEPESKLLEIKILPTIGLWQGLGLDLAPAFQNSFSKNYPCCHAIRPNRLINRMIVLCNNRQNCHKMMLECHRKEQRTCLRCIKTNLLSIALELRFCCF